MVTQWTQRGRAGTLHGAVVGMCFFTHLLLHLSGLPESTLMHTVDSASSAMAALSGGLW